MRAKLLIVVLLFMTVIPVLSPNGTRNATNRNSFTALAGHTGFGNYCEDGTPGCLPGDPPLTRTTRPVGATQVKQSNPSGFRSNIGVVLTFELLTWIVALM